MGKVVIDPFSRIEGHLKIEALVEGGVIKDARSSGTLFRGIELILKGRDPRDAQRITQRICGVCPTPHSVASALCLDDAFGIADKIPENGRILRNLILGAALIADHILHFYHLAALDYVDIAGVLEYEGKDPLLLSLKDFARRGELYPFFPRFEGDYRLPKDTNLELVYHYVKAFEARRKAQELSAIFGGKLPHDVGIIPGGVTSTVTVDKMAAFLWRLNELREFIDNTYLPDVMEVAKVYSDYLDIGGGPRRLLSYGGFDLEVAERDLTKRKRLFVAGSVDGSFKYEPLSLDEIIEHVRYSWYDGEKRHFSEGETVPNPKKEGAYSWIKAPRYKGEVYQVGPLARVMVSYGAGVGVVREVVDKALSELGASAEKVFSVMGRHLCRAIETKIVADAMASWVLELKPGEPAWFECEVPSVGRGVGIHDAARGALLHFIEIKDRKIEKYQCVVPTTWNASPRDDEGRPGAIEQALIGTGVRDEGNPFEIVRIVRSFDPCLACAVHLIDGRGRVEKFRV